MKAEYKPKEQPVADLAKGKLYDVQDIKRKTQEEWLLIENESKQKVWYKARDFVLHAEAAAYIEDQTAAGAGQGAAQSATPDGAQIMREINAAAGFTARQGAEIGKAIAAGIKDGIMLHYGA